MRALGVDFGGVRIGLAVMDRERGIPRPLPALSATGTLAKDAKAISGVASKEEADLVVVGVPLTEGQETKMSGVCRKLGAAISALGIRVEFVDEALTSMEAEEEMRAGGLRASQMRRKVDGEAAARILERWGAIEQGG